MYLFTIANPQRNILLHMLAILIIYSSKCLIVHLTTHCENEKQKEKIIDTNAWDTYAVTIM